MSAPQNRGPFPTLRTCNPFLPSCCQKGFGHLNAKLFSSLLLSNPLEAVPTHTHCQTALVFHRGIAPTRCLTDLPAPVPREHCYQSPVSGMELLLGQPQTALSVLQLSSSSSDHPVCSLLSCSGTECQGKELLQPQPCSPPRTVPAGGCTAASQLDRWQSRATPRPAGASRAVSPSDRL